MWQAIYWRHIAGHKMVIFFVANMEVTAVDMLSSYTWFLYVRAPVGAKHMTFAK